MKNYRESDYALNKYSKGIVYKFADGIVVVTLEDYLRENPDKTEADFQAIKRLSDEWYLDQVRLETAQGNKRVSLNGLEETHACATRALDDEYIESEEKKRVMIAVDKLFREGRMTQKQKRRFIQHYIYGLSLRQIAAAEAVHFTSVEESLKSVSDKLRRFFENL